MPLIMLIVNTERSVKMPTTPVSPTATRIAISAVATGMSPATTAPNTSSRTISATGSPNSSSPLRRSSSESALCSVSNVHSPVVRTVNVPSLAERTRSITLSPAASSTRPASITTACRDRAAGLSLT
jgi:hypothetical protein